MVDYKELVILIAEDDDGHTELIKSGLQKSGVRNEIIRFSDGEETWKFLSGTGKDKILDPMKSYLLLLDINMPLMDGVEVLRRMKADPGLSDIPVMMLTTTDDPREVEQCYKLGCSVYITKPVEFTEFARTLKSLGLFLQVIKVQQE